MTTTIIHTEAELHALLDSLTPGQTVTTTWADREYRTTITGPVWIDGTFTYCARTLRTGSSVKASGELVSRLVSFEATVEQSVTVTPDDPDTLLELVESLTDGQTVTAEWRSKDGERVAIITGPTRRGVADGIINMMGLWGEHRLSTFTNLPPDLHSVTTTVVKTIRWEREA